jgi:hypothetical protein
VRPEARALPHSRRLSKGTRQRVGIAEAILAEPAAIIMDEPTIGFDAHQILIVRDLIAGLRGRMSVIISSHILPEIEVTCDRVLIIDGGRIVAQGSPAELRHQIFGQTSYRVELAGDTAALPVLLRDAEPSLRVAALGECGPDGFCVATPATEARRGSRRDAPHLPARAGLPRPRPRPHHALARGRVSRRHPAQLGRPPARSTERRQPRAAATALMLTFKVHGSKFTVHGFKVHGSRFTVHLSTILRTRLTAHHRHRSHQFAPTASAYSLVPTA